SAAIPAANKPPLEQVLPRQNKTDSNPSRLITTQGQRRRSSGIRLRTNRSIARNTGTRQAKIIAALFGLSKPKLQRN
ncbi:MAG: hypothetical protein WCL00_12960, partial [Bacteroidota bacterium]